MQSSEQPGQSKKTRPKLSLEMPEPFPIIQGIQRLAPASSRISTPRPPLPTEHATPAQGLERIPAESNLVQVPQEIDRRGNTKVGILGVQWGWQSGGRDGGMSQR